MSTHIQVPGCITVPYYEDTTGRVFCSLLQANLSAPSNSIFLHLLLAKGVLPFSVPFVSHFRISPHVHAFLLHPHSLFACSAYQHTQVSSILNKQYPRQPQIFYPASFKCPFLHEFTVKLVKRSVYTSDLESLPSHSFTPHPTAVSVLKAPLKGLLPQPEPTVSPVLLQRAILIIATDRYIPAGKASCFCSINLLLPLRLLFLYLFHWISFT